MKKETIKKNLPSFILIGCTAVLITVTGIKFNQSFFRILPLFISLFVANLQSRVNRYGSLLGSLARFDMTLWNRPAVLAILD